MTNSKRGQLLNTLDTHFFTGAQVGINTTDGTEDGTVEYVGWDHDLDAPFVAVRVPSERFDYAIARVCITNVYRKA